MKSLVMVMLSVGLLCSGVYSIVKTGETAQRSEAIDIEQKPIGVDTAGIVVTPARADSLVSVLRVKYQHLTKDRTPKQVKKRIEFVLSQMDSLIIYYDGIIEQKKRELNSKERQYRGLIAKLDSIDREK